MNYKQINKMLNVVSITLEIIKPLNKIKNSSSLYVKFISYITVNTVLVE
jgi:hypothetical protein